MIVSLDEGGKISISYLGTDPALSAAATPESREINYDEQDQEMAKLQQIIRESTTPMGKMWQYVRPVLDNEHTSCMLDANV